MAPLVQEAQPPLEFISPQFNRWIWQGVTQALPLWLRWQGQIDDVQIEASDRLIDCYQRFQSGQLRFLIAFRHPTIFDPACLVYALGHLLPQAARRQSIFLQGPLHAHFVYDRGIPLWAGSGSGWLFSRLGATPIQRGKLDRMGLRTARNLLVNGSMPLALAPEGGVNGHSELISPLEPGAAQLAFWGVEDLQKAEARSEAVWILPVGLRYRYQEPPWAGIAELLSDLEAQAGITPASKSADQPQEAWLYQRLIDLAMRLLHLMEQFYNQFYPGPALDPDPSATLADRLKALLDRALSVTEQYFQLQPNGPLIERCRRVEQAGWDRIYREDLKDPESLTPLERGLADRIASEASFWLWHMRLVERFVAVTGQYVRENPSGERFAETLQLIQNLCDQIQGQQSPQSHLLGRQQAQIRVGEPLSVTDRWDQYQVNRRAARQAVTDLTQDLEAALKSLL